MSYRDEIGSQAVGDVLLDDPDAHAVMKASLTKGIDYTSMLEQALITVANGKEEANKKLLARHVNKPLWVEQLPVKWNSPDNPPNSVLGRFWVAVGAGGGEVKVCLASYNSKDSRWRVPVTYLVLGWAECKAPEFTGVES